MPGLPRLCHLARVRPDHSDAVRGEACEIAPRCPVRPHLWIHRRRNQDRAVGREQHCGRKVAGVASRHLGDEVGGRGRNDNEVGLAREPDVADIELIVASNRSVNTRSPDSAPADERRDELLSGAR